MDIKDAIDNFVLACAAENKARRTIADYRYFLETFAKFTGSIAVRQISPDLIRQYLVHSSSLMGRGGNFKAPSSVLKEYQVIRTFMRYLYDQRIIKERVTDLVKPPRIPPTRPSVLTDEHIDLLLTLLFDAGNFRNLVIFEFFLDTGCRLNEVVGLDLSDVFMEQRYAKVLGKGSKPGIVPFGRRIARDLHTYIHHHRVPGGNALFTNEDGERLAYEGMKTMIRRTMETAGIDGKHGAHILRHTFATNFLRRGGDLETLRIILRHNNIKTTQIYIHLQTEDILSIHAAASPMDHYGR